MTLVSETKRIVDGRFAVEGRPSVEGWCPSVKECPSMAPRRALLAMRVLLAVAIARPLVGDFVLPAGNWTRRTSLFSHQHFIPGYNEAGEWDVLSGGNWTATNHSDANLVGDACRVRREGVEVHVDEALGREGAAPAREVVGVPARLATDSNGQ